MTWKHTRSGRAVDLVNPLVESIDIEDDIAVSLSLIKRFDGHAGSPVDGYSVAQHCVLGSDALLRETDDAAVALAFLLHDAHEAYTGDIASPVALGLDAIATQITRGRGKHVVRDAINVMKERVDAVIMARLGLAWPWPGAIQAAVRAMDIRMLKAERDQLMLPPPRPWHSAVEKAAPVECGDIECWPSWLARERWLARLYALHPPCAPEWRREP